MYTYIYSVSVNAHMRMLRTKISFDSLKKIRCIKMTHCFSTSNGSEFIYNAFLLSVASYMAEILQIHSMIQYL